MSDPQHSYHTIGNTHPIKSAWIAVVAFAYLLRSLVARHSYSGHGSPPMFGDLEAQRHWMELALHLPADRWYFHDLGYWGLDYPPLTAFVSYGFGFLAHLINPQWVALHSSRGLEHPSLIAYLRFSVLICDVLLYLPACLLFVQYVCHVDNYYAKLRSLLVVLLFPTLILIDHGHFQYNLIMLALCMYTFTALSMGMFLISAFTFSLALLFKQMALYYALPVFVYLLGHCFNPRSNGLKLFIMLGCVVIATFAIHLYPFRTHLDQVLTRVFPLSRGLYEDKVANLWCTLAPLYKLRSKFNVKQLAQLSTLVTLSTSLVTLIPLFRTSRTSAPNPTRLLLSLVSVSLAFFLFSFQVHEKSILIPNLPAILLMCMDFEGYGSWVSPFLSLSLFSLFPLLRKDGLAIPYFVMSFGWFVWTSQLKGRVYEYWIRNVFVLACLSIHALELSVPPPVAYPDLYVVLNQICSCMGFVLVWIKVTYLSCT